MGLNLKKKGLSVDVDADMDAHGIHIKQTIIFNVTSPRRYGMRKGKKNKIKPT